MKIKSLLAAVSMVAITAGSANALDITTTSTPIKLANELDLTATPVIVTVPFSLDITTVGGFFTSSQVTRVTITPPAGTTINVASITNANLPTSIAGSDGILSNNATISSVTPNELIVDVTPNTNESGLGFSIPMTVSSCPPAGGVLTVSAALASGNVAVENGTVTSNAITPTCVDGITGVVASDEATSNTQIALGDYNALTPTVGTDVAGGNGNTLGTVNYTINPMAVIDGAGTAMTSGDIASIAFDVTFVDASGIGSVFYAGIPCAAPTTANPNAFRCTANGASVAIAVDGVADLIEVTAKGPTGTGATAMVNAIVNQGVSVSNATVSFSDANANFQSSEPGATGDLDALNRQGKNFGVFDWNGISGTDNVYRVTGLTGPTVGTVTFTNDVNGKNGEFPITLTPTNGEAVLTSFTAFGTTNTDYRRADVKIFLETNDPVDIDRLMIRNGIVTNFGDGSNSSVNAFDPMIPNFDDDNVSGAVTE